MGALSARGKTDKITAYAGGGQALATRITKPETIIDVSAAPLSSIKFPPANSESGETYEIVNKGANTVSMYPSENNYLFVGTGLKAINAPQTLNVNARVTVRCYKGENGIMRII